MVTTKSIVGMENLVRKKLFQDSNLHQTLHQDLLLSPVEHLQSLSGHCVLHPIVESSSPIQVYEEPQCDYKKKPVNHSHCFPSWDQLHSQEADELFQHFQHHWQQVKEWTLAVVCSHAGLHLLFELHAIVV